MKKLFCIFQVAMILSLSCSNIKQPECENMICTQEFRMVQVKFNDASGNPVAVKDFSAINKRTGETTVQDNEPATINTQGIYTVASDADLKKLTESGDVIMVSASHPLSNKKIETEFVVSGGRCACHISKVSGPAELTF